MPTHSPSPYATGPNLQSTLNYTIMTKKLHLIAYISYTCENQFKFTPSRGHTEVLNEPSMQPPYCHDHLSWPTNAPYVVDQYIQHTGPNILAVYFEPNVGVFTPKTLSPTTWNNNTQNCVQMHTTCWTQW